MPLCNDTIKNREIRFKLSTPDQAKKAEQLLSGVPGIEHTEVTAPCCMHISYNVEELTLQMIESALREVGFDLDDGLIVRLKRAVFSYCEDASDITGSASTRLAQTRLKTATGLTRYCTKVTQIVCVGRLFNELHTNWQLIVRLQPAPSP